MPHKNHNAKHRRSILGNTIPPSYAQYPPMLTKWTADIDKYARKKGRKQPRVLRHHYE